ncbi:hypothetical protein ERJ75_001238800 [Trypanosoma vivax]|nr:hypothetical protein ERJ75_001238800 [Trypanosoma vivax]
MVQKHPEKQLSSGAAKVQDAPDSDGEAEQEDKQQKEFVCQQCHRVLQSKAWLTRHKCEPTSITNSEGSNVAEQPVTAARPICGKECHYRWLLRHMLTKHPGHDESLRPQPRAKPKRKETRTEARAQAEWSVMLGSAGDGDGDAERPRKRRQLGRRTELDTTYPPLRQRSRLGCAPQEPCKSVSGKPTRHPSQSASMFRWMKRG